MSQRDGVSLSGVYPGSFRGECMSVGHMRG